MYTRRMPEQFLFCQREGFIIQCEGLDEATGEKERPVSVLDMSLARIGEL